MIKKILQGLIPMVLIFSLILMPGAPVSAASTGPYISSQSPSKGSTGVSVSIQPNINFSRAMDNTTINAANIQLMNGGNAISATVTLSGTKKAIIKPDVPLNYSTAYYILVGTGVKDSLGNPLASPYGSAATSGFTTIAPKAPAVTLQYPAKGAISVSLAVQPYVIFSKAMDYTTIDNTTVQLLQNGTPVASSVTLEGPFKAIITPTNPLRGGTVYYLAVTTGAKDTTGMALAAAYGSASTSTFTTATATPPVILSRYPVDNATAVPFKIQPYINFSKSMDPTTINSTNIQLLDGSTPVAITVALMNYTRAVITPAAALGYSKTYSIVVGIGVKDAFGNALAAPSTSTFTTDNAVPPAIYSIYPADTATGVDPDVQPCIIFSEVLDPATVNSANIKLMQGANVVRSTAAVYGTTIVMLTPLTSLEPNTAYSILVSTGIKDVSGNAMAAPSTTAFTTGAAAAPAVSSQYPVNSATAVPIDVKPCVIFSKEMNPSTINSTNILLKKGTSTIRATVTLYGKYSAIIAPQVPLAGNTTYYILVNTGVKDLDGNSMSAAYGSPAASGFVTAASTLLVVSAFPPDNSTGVPLNTQPCIVFSQALDATTVDGTKIQLLDGGNPVASTVALYDENTAIICPSAALVLSKTYTIHVATGIKDVDGNVLGAQFSSAFTMVTANSAPAVSYLCPADNSTGAPVNTQVCLVFSREMDVNTINSTNFQILNGATPIVISVIKYGKNTIILKPVTALNSSTVYSIVIASAVKDIDGNNMVSTTTRFTTGP